MSKQSKKDKAARKEARKDVLNNIVDIRAELERRTNVLERVYASLWADRLKLERFKANVMGSKLSLEELRETNLALADLGDCDGMDF